MALDVCAQQNVGQRIRAAMRFYTNGRLDRGGGRQVVGLPHIGRGPVLYKGQIVHLGEAQNANIEQLTVHGWHPARQPHTFPAASSTSQAQVDRTRDWHRIWKCRWPLKDPPDIWDSCQQSVPEMAQMFSKCPTNHLRNISIIAEWTKIKWTRRCLSS